MSQKRTGERHIIKEYLLSSFETTYKENYRDLFYVALKMTNDKDIVCDILQDVFSYYHKVSLNGHNIIKPKNWLMRATINKCIDYSKYKKRYTTLDSIKDVASTEKATDYKFDKEIINLALSKLKTKERTLAILYSEGYSYKEIAKISGIKLSSVGKSLSRVIQKLDEILKKMGHEMYQQ